MKRKLFALGLAVCMALSLNVTSFAATPTNPSDEWIEQREQVIMAEVDANIQQEQAEYRAEHQEEIQLAATRAATCDEAGHIHASQLTVREYERTLTQDGHTYKAIYRIRNCAWCGSYVDGPTLVSMALIR